MAARILVIDGDPAVRRLACELLEASGFTAETAESGPAGLRQAAARPPDLVLLDAGLPEGYQICRRFREGAAGEAAPVIMLTAGTGPAVTSQAYQAGAAACLLKPLRRESLGVLVAAILASRPAGAADTP